MSIFDIFGVEGLLQIDVFEIGLKCNDRGSTIWKRSLTLRNWRC